MVPLAMIRLLEKERLLQRRFEECCVTVDKAVGKALAQRPLMPPVSWAIHSAYRGRPSELKAKKTRQNFWEDRRGKPRNPKTLHKSPASA